MSTATARPRPKSLIDAIVAEHEAAEHADHDRGGGGDDPGGGGEAVGDRVGVVAGAVVLLLDAGEEEHLVVHREAEHDREEHHRRPRLDRPGLARRRRGRSRPSPLEHRDDHAVRGADRQQVHDHGLERHERSSGTRPSAAGTTAPSTAPMKSGRRADEDVGEVRAAAVKPPTYTVHVGALGRRGDDVVAQVVDSFVVASSCGAEVGNTWITAVSPAGFGIAAASRTPLRAPASARRGGERHRPLCSCRPAGRPRRATGR